MRACNICKKFIGFGAHWLSGKCPLHDEITMWDYTKTAEQCRSYDSDFVSCCEDCNDKLCKRRSESMTACSNKS